MTTLTLDIFGQFWGFSQKSYHQQKTQKNFRQVSSFESGFKLNIRFLRFFEKLLLQKFTPIEGSETAMPYLNIGISHFGLLKTLIFLKGKIISASVQYHVLGGLMAGLINQKKPRKQFDLTTENWKKWKIGESEWQ